MDYIKQILEVGDLKDAILWVLAFMIAINYGFDIVKKFSKTVGLPFKWLTKENKDHELLNQTILKLNQLEIKHNEAVEKSIDADKKIEENLDKLTDMFVKKQINDMRWEIINFSNDLTAGKNCNRDSFRHCIRTYEEYEALLEENNMENGEVAISMEIVNEAYKNILLKDKQI